MPRQQTRQQPTIDPMTDTMEPAPQMSQTPPVLTDAPQVVPASITVPAASVLPEAARAYIKDETFNVVASHAFLNDKFYAHPKLRNYDMRYGMMKFKQPDFDLQLRSYEDFLEMVYTKYYQPMKLDEIAKVNVRVAVRILQVLVAWPVREAANLIQRCCLLFDVRVNTESKIGIDGNFSEMTRGACMDCAKKHADSFIRALTGEEYALLRTRTNAEPAVFTPILQRKVMGLW